MFGLPKLLTPSPRAIVLTLLGNTANRLMDFLFPAPTWGVYKTGTTQLAFDVSSVFDLGISGSSVISNYPIEEGTFTSYNKVVNPNTYPIRLARDGSQSQRTAFLNWLENSKNSFDLFDVLCPERTYKNVTLESYRIIRTSESGAAMILADCLFQEIRQIPAAYTTTGVPAPENQPATPTVRVNPIPDSNVVGFPL